MQDEHRQVGRMNIGRQDDLLSSRSSLFTQNSHIDGSLQASAFSFVVFPSDSQLAFSTLDDSIPLAMLHPWEATTLTPFALEAFQARPSSFMLSPPGATLSRFTKTLFAQFPES